MSIRLDVRVTGHGRSGQLFAGSVAGEDVVTSTTTPLFNACRVLQAKGVTGPIEMWGGEPYPRMQTTIEAGAKRTVDDGKRGIRFARWFPDVRAARQRQSQGGPVG